MPTATMTAKGQVTIPKEIRDRLKLKTGDKILFYVGADGRVSLVAKNKSIKDIAGMLHRPGMKALTIEEINNGIAAAAAESGMAGSRQKA